MQHGLDRPTCGSQKWGRYSQGEEVIQPSRLNCRSVSPILFSRSQSCGLFSQSLLCSFSPQPCSQARSVVSGNGQPPIAAGSGQRLLQLHHPARPPASVAAMPMATALVSRLLNPQPLRSLPRFLWATVRMEHVRRLAPTAVRYRLVAVLVATVVLRCGLVAEADNQPPRSQQPRWLLFS